MMLRNITQGSILLHTETEGMLCPCLGLCFQRPGRRGGGERLSVFVSVSELLNEEVARLCRNEIIVLRA